MINLTKKAAQQITQSARQSGSEDMGLRIAARVNDEGEVELGMGFDVERTNDAVSESYGVTLLVHPSSAPYLEDITLDYIEPESGEPHFIFMKPEQEEKSGDE